jgi:hypothetical protein
VDFDGDGLLDVLSGSYSPGDLYLFKRQADGTFAEGAIVKNDKDKPVNVGAAAHVYAADWDSDGDLDLVIGNISGEVYLVANNGSRKEPSYGKGQKLSAAGKKISVGHGDAGPAVADWDGDGRLDLVVGAGDGSVSFYRNQGSSQEPSLAEGVVLIAANTDGFNPDKASSDKCGTRTKVCVTDFNGDGRLDLLVGDFAMAKENEPELTAEERKAQDEAQKKYDEAIARYQKALEKLGANKLREEWASLLQPPENETDEQKEKREERIAELRREMTELSQKLGPELKELQEAASKIRRSPYTYHGFVWLVAQEAPATASR